jgi:hypothetical protein
VDGHGLLFSPWLFSFLPTDPATVRSRPWLFCLLILANTGRRLSMNMEKVTNQPFIKGLQLSEWLYKEAVKPILAAHFPGLTYSAALLGHGSEVLGLTRPSRWTTTGDRG